MMPLAGRHVLIAGVTTRPFAASAVRAGFRVTAVDAFGDRDLREFAEVILARSAAGHNFDPIAAAQAAASIPAQFAAYTSNFENHPAAVTRLATGRRLLGNPASSLTRIRNPIELMRVLQRAGLPTPQARSRAPGASSPRASWLLKPRRSGGGKGIRRWSSGQPVPRGMYLQERIPGVPGSVSFVANGSSAVLLGLSRQLVGEADFGVGQYRYCGSLVAKATPLFSGQAELLQWAAKMATVLTREFRLVGLNGLDFIARRGIPYLTEVNPRYSSSMELIERSTGVSMFEAHLRACSGTLPVELSPETKVHGKAVVFARRDTEIGKLPQHPGAAWIADVPHPGERISRGSPICTVFAEGRTVETCRRTLGVRAAAVYRCLRARVGRAA